MRKVLIRPHAKWPKKITVVPALAGESILCLIESPHYGFPHARERRIYRECVVLAMLSTQIETMHQTELSLLKGKVLRGVLTEDITKKTEGTSSLCSLVWRRINIVPHLVNLLT